MCVPFYLEQTKIGKPYITYMDKNAKLRGFKRYYTQEDNYSGDYDDKQLRNDKVFIKFKPVDSGAKFNCKIRI